MGKLRALRLGITKGLSHSDPEPEYKPICPKEHDIESLTRLISKDRKWKMTKKTADMASKIIGQSVLEGLDDLVLVNALKFHDEECVRGPNEKWCHCHWCDERREILTNGHD